MQRYVTKLNLLLAACLLVLFGGTNAYAANASLEIDATTLATGEQATIRVVIRNAEPKNTPSLKLPQGVMVVSGPSTESRFQIIGNSRSHTVAYVYGVAFMKAGTIHIPPVVIDTSIGRLATNSLNVTVRNSAIASWMFAEATLSPTTAYVGHTVTATFKFGFMANRNVVGVKMTIPFFEKKSGLRIVDVTGIEKKWQEHVNKFRRAPNNLQRLTIENVGDMIAEIDTEMRGGVQYATYTIKRLIIPETEGEFKFNPAWVMLQSRKSDRYRRGRVESGQANTAPLSLVVRPTPSENRPTDYEGTIGSYSLAAKLSAMRIAFGEPIMLDVVVKGEGNLETISTPKLTDDADFRIGTIEQEKKELFQSGRYLGEKRFIITLHPRRPDIKSVPGVRLVTFDSNTGEYKTLTTKPLPIEIDVADNLGAFDSVKLEDNTKSELETELVRDIEDIKTNYDATDNSYSTAGFIFRMLLPFLLVAAVYPLVTKRRKLRSDDIYAKRVYAFKNALAAFDTLDANNDAPSELARIVKNYISDKLGRAQGELTAIEARELITESELAKKAESILLAATDAKYGGGTLDVQAAITEAKDFIERFEESNL